MGITKEAAARVLKLLTYNKTFLQKAGVDAKQDVLRLDIDHYILEWADPQHRAPNLLRPLLAEWKGIFKENKLHGRANLSFWDWLESEEKLQGEEGVEYLDDDGRLLREIVVSGQGLLYYKKCGTLFDTKNKATSKNGTGWACFVISPDDRLYSDSHVNGKFHHSSFLAGAPVKGAGEIVVERGALSAFTPKSGHYKPPARTTEMMARWFDENNMGRKMIVMPDNDMCCFVLLKNYLVAARVIHYGIREEKISRSWLNRQEIEKYIPEWARTAGTNISTAMDLLVYMKLG
jgi:hypothetical protein